MKLIVDANIVFSAILNTNGKIGDLLMNSRKQFKFIAPEFLRIEVAKHYTKLAKISGCLLLKYRNPPIIFFNPYNLFQKSRLSNPLGILLLKYCMI